MKLAVIASLVLMAAGCARNRVAGIDHALQTGASQYPPGTDSKCISEARQAKGGLGPRYAIAGFCVTLEDGFATAALARANPSTRPTGYYLISTPRAGAGSSFGAFGMYFDYLFVDANNRVVFAARRRVD